MKTGKDKKKTDAALATGSNAPDIAGERPLEVAIGRRIRDVRTRRGLTVTALAGASGLSIGMLSKVEHGQISPSLTTLETIANALSIPMASLFESEIDRADASYVPAGKGVSIERRGSRHGHHYTLLGATLRGPVTIEPYLIRLDEGADPYPHFRHEGVEFLHILSGAMTYRHGNSTYQLSAGDSLTFDAGVAHGPEALTEKPVVFLSTIVYQRSD